MLLPDSDDSLTPSQDLDIFLKSMVAQGSVNSSGIFTIDIQAALPKLEKFQLPKPYFGILKVIQSAVVSQARHLSAYSSSAGTTIEHDGIPPSPDQLKNLLSYLLAQDENNEYASLRELAIGLNTSLARGASWVEITVKTENGWTSQRWASREDSKLVEKPRSNKPYSLRFTIRNSAGQFSSSLWSRIHSKDILGMLTGSRDDLDDDIKVIFDRCRFAPLSISINSKKLPPAAATGTIKKRWSAFKVVEHRKGNLIEVYLQCEKESAYLLSVPNKSEARLKYLVEGSFDGQSYAAKSKLLKVYQAPRSRSFFAIVGIRPLIHTPGEIIIIKNGVELTRLTPPGLPGGITAIMSAEGLKLDLSQFRLVDTPLFHNRMQWLSNLAISTINEVRQSVDFATLSDSDIEFLNSFQLVEP